MHASFIYAAISLGALFAASATQAGQPQPIKTDVRLSGTDVEFVVKNGGAGTLVAGSVLLVGNNGCRVQVEKKVGVQIPAGTDVVIAKFPLRDLIKSCALVSPGATDQFGSVRNVSSNENYRAQPKAMGVWSYTRNVPFAYQVGVKSIDNSTETTTLTSGYVHFVNP